MKCPVRAVPSHVALWFSLNATDMQFGPGDLDLETFQGLGAIESERARWQREKTKREAAEDKTPSSSHPDGMLFTPPQARYARG